MEIKVCGSVAPYPRCASNCSSFLVKEDDYKVLLDCGPGSTRYIDMLKDLKNLAVFISHYHPDHYSDLLSLMYATYTNHNLGYLDSKVRIYLPKVQDNSLPKCNEYGELYPHISEEMLTKQYLTYPGRESYVSFHEYEEKTLVNIGPMDLEFALNPHNIKAFSTKISSRDGTLVYSSDTGYEGNKVESLAKNADILICEASYLRGFNRKKDHHLYAYEAGKIASKANVKNLILFHNYPEIPKEAYVLEAQEYFPHTFMASEGDIFELKNHKVLKKENKEELI